MKKLRRAVGKKLFMLFGLGAVAAISLGFAEYSPGSRKAAALKTQLEEQRRRIRLLSLDLLPRESEKLMLSDRLSRKLGELEKKHEMAAAYVPQSPEIGRLLGEIWKAAFEAGAEMVVIRTEQLVYRSFYDELPVRVSIRCGFFELEKFFGKIEGMDRLLSVESFRLESDENIPPVISSELMIRAFILKGSVVTDKLGVGGEG